VAPEPARATSAHQVFGAPRRNSEPVITDEPQPARTHRIVDGDTLELIADRYYGNPAYADRIFRLNRDKLAAADLLPLGTVLELPTEEELANAGATRPLSKSAVSADGAENEASRTPLGPIGL
jgi:nucleoid-associated protein YgaU